MYILLISNHTFYLVQFIYICKYFKYHLFEKLIRANEFQIELETVSLPILTHECHLKIN